ncbi:MAG TPA: hypothetical protein VHA35_13035 [Dongiaceae bacterium]|jgi:hypothetical protein|nr:hypothetical protein [Dongiaceae bacterium]
MIGAALTAAQDQEFFRWFSLERYEPAQALADGRTWHGFRPSGEKFQALVTVNLETDAGGRIVDAKLCLDRAFVEHPKDGAFARDITASFLRWALPRGQQGAVDGFLGELGDLGPNVVRLARAPAAPPGSPGPLHRVYLGRDKDAEQRLAGAVLRLTNLQARDGPRDPQHDWIWIRVLAAEAGEPRHNPV